MTEEQLDKYLEYKKDILPIIQADVKLLTPYIQKLRVYYNVDNLQNLLLIRQRNPSFEVIREIENKVLKDNGYLIKYIKNPTEVQQVYAVVHSGLELVHIKNPTQLVKKYAVQNNGHRIQFIRNPSQELKKIAIKSRSTRIKFIKDPSQELQLLAVTKFPKRIENIQNPSQATKKVAKQYFNSNKAEKQILLKYNLGTYKKLFDEKDDRLPFLAGVGV